MTKEELAILFHDTYEKLAPEHGYETRNDTRLFDPNTPNGKLMIAVCDEVMRELGIYQIKEAISSYVRQEISATVVVLIINNKINRRSPTQEDVEWAEMVLLEIEGEDGV